MDAGSQVPGAGWADRPSPVFPADDPRALHPAGAAPSPRSRRHRGWLAVAVAVLAVGAAVGADWAVGGPPFHRSSTDLCNGPPIDLVGTLSSGLAPQANGTFDELGAEYGNVSKGCVTTTLEPGSGGDGFTQFAAGVSEFVVLGAVPTAAEQAQFPLPVLYFPESVGAVAIVYHLAGLPERLNLTAAALAGIFLGSIQNWSDPALEALNPGALGAGSGAIAPAYLNGSTYATASLTAYLAASNLTWNASVGAESTPTGFRGTGVAGTEAMLAYVASTPGAIGYVPGNPSETGVGTAGLQDAAGDFAGPNASGLDVAASAAGSALLQAIATSGGSITPGPDLTTWNVPTGWSYPLTSFTYLLLYHDVGFAYGERLTLQAGLWFLNFLEWLTSGGQAWFVAPGTVPLPSVVAAISISVLEHVEYRGTLALTGGGSLGDNDTGGEA